MEQHPLTPFLPENAKLLMLGSFPPSQKRWSMEFYYPNWMNDMWRIVGQIFFNDPLYFCVPSEKRFNKDLLVQFLTEKGIALSDTAQAVTRLKGTAADADLQIDVPMDIPSFLRQLPQCNTVATTGGKAADELAAMFAIEAPKVGEYTNFTFEDRPMRFYRMPSSSRAYPLPLAKKAEAYGVLFKAAGFDV
ncbi:MAG: uracil-DNA glycosylase family protein [Paludibacteraceae bacterium]|nr:uracil-DNA glycosylase family protein [Paludibacteraceae bacterium]